MVVKRRRPKPLLIIIVTIATLLILLASLWIYLESPVDSKSDTNIEVIIPAGTSTKGIADVLKEKRLIKSKLFFQIYVKINNKKSLKASTYIMKPNMSLEEITNILEKGNSYNPDVITITFKEGKRITDYAKEIAKYTIHDYDEVLAILSDKQYAATLIQKYWFLTDAILQEGIYYPLEGYLAPDTYNFENQTVSVEKIIETMLDQTMHNLEKYKSQLNTDIHYYVTMASIVELEGTNTKNRKMIVGVFENRLKSGMNLGSDVTTYYALQHPMTKDLTTEQFATVNPYNTRSTTMMGKMPIGPICNPSTSSLEASINKTDNDYLYFVADKNGKIYYTSTLADHNATVKEIKEKGDWIW